MLIATSAMAAVVTTSAINRARRLHRRGATGCGPRWTTVGTASDAVPDASVSLATQHVPEPAVGVNQRLTGRIDLASQIGNVGRNHRVVAVEIGAPNGVQQL